MRRLTAFVTAMAAVFCGCSKHNNAGNPYYFTFQSGNITYSSPMVDSLLQCRDTVGSTFGFITLSSFRTPQQTDSAVAGLSKLATWTFSLADWGAPYGAFAGIYTTDTSAGNQKMISVWNSDFRFYTSYDPHQGVYYMVPGLLFTVTITQFTSSWIEGTFEGRVMHSDGLTNVGDTATVTNGKFKLPLTR